MEAAARTLDREGFVVIRDALHPAIAATCLHHINALLPRVCDAVSRRALEREHAFGAIAPPAADVPHRWNLLLPVDDVVRDALRETLKKVEPVVRDAVGDDAVLCDLSALIADPQCLDQRLHFDTRWSDGETEEKEEEKEECKEEETEEEREGASLRRRYRRQKQRRLVSIFVALQNVRDDMGPTVMVPRTCTQTVHDAVEVARSAGTDAITAELFSREHGPSDTGAVRCVMRTGDAVVMDSRTLHRGSANTANVRRVLLDFAFVSPASVPSTYCECIRAELREKYALRRFPTWALSTPRPTDVEHT